MPAIVKMSLSNGNPTTSQLAMLARTVNKQASVVKTATPLSSPMVGRIHNVRPGCGSCGR
jgi:hypothetical protein